MPHPLNEELLHGAIRADMMDGACKTAIWASLPSKVKKLSYLLGLYSPGRDDLKRAGVVVNPFNGLLRFEGAP